MKFDEILCHYLGDFGPYQRKIYLLICLPAIWCSVNMFCWTFTGVEIPHRCKLNQNDMHFSTYYQRKNETCTRMSNITKQMEPCHEFLFDNSEIATSAVQDWLLVCDKKWLTAIIHSLFYLGILLGSLVLGLISDRIGRKRVILIGSVTITFLSLACSLSPNVYIFAVFRFLQGFLEPSLWQVPFVIALEMVGPSKRVIAGMAIEFFFTSGLILLGILAYFVRNWRTLQIIVALPGFFFLTYHWLIPESPRWLLATGRKQQAVDILRLAARYNRVFLPDSVLDSLQAENEEDKKKDEQGQREKRMRLSKQEGTIGLNSGYGYQDLVRTPNMRRKTVICCYCWTVVTMIYYGISLNPSAIAGDFYLSFILSGLAEFPALIFLLFTLNGLGRKCLQIGGFSFAGLSLIVIVVIPPASKLAMLLLVLLAKSAATAAFCVIYLHTSEIFPTVVRGIALGLMVTCSRIGGIISPFASIFISDNFRSTVLISFGVLAILAAVMTLTLPETTYQKLPETLVDGENFGKEISLFCSSTKTDLVQIEEYLEKC